MEMKKVNGYWFPLSDTQCHPRMGECADADLAIEHILGLKKVCVQAGGNVGVWASYLAKTFEKVWTFEPDFENYHCLLKNIPPNVVHFFAGLGHKQSLIGLDRTPDNCGAHQTILAGGNIPLMTIDDLDLEHCDLICLDIEGMEPLALEGAKETIKRFKPVLMIEDKDISRRYGFRRGWTEREILGYRVAGHAHNDVILVPE